MDFPDAFGPMSAVMAPSGTENDERATATEDPYRYSTSFASIANMGGRVGRRAYGRLRLPNRRAYRSALPRLRFGPVPSLCFHFVHTNPLRLLRHR